ncbi:hypothetical protein [Adhaeribacter rhizoryzae]|uniref:DUF456 domain-containing protein n=1 Tax=Adhaeribacter rhizoryzae TaxID=2607907 RepID=A0A5M6CX84_9BACT|nr:hypothetical protein [Adhaeribacter rhizoryzae]KAA5539831.1 hypothetical protein F0145_23890 [Adhaeribacter rhizoryzae]
MKKHLLLLLLFSAIQFSLQAQDLIITLTGDELLVKVTEITQQDVVYKHPDSLQSLPRTIPKKQVFMVKYSNGTKEIISHIDPQTNSLTALDSREMYERGRADARKYYKGNGPMWGTAAATMLAGLPGPIIIGAIPPKINYQQVSEITLLQNQHYVRGYKQQAHNKKIKKVVAGTGIGAGLMVALLYAFISSAGY